MRRAGVAWGGLSVLLGSLCAHPVAATYSIAATDSATQQVGGAVTSCVGSLDLAAVYGSVPGKGVIHAQAQLDTQLRGKNLAVMLLGQGLDPTEIIARITAQSLDSGFASRQYGVVDVQGRAAGFTGSRAQAYRSDQHASFRTFSYSVQGNILTSQKVLDQAAAGFEGAGCDLADRLMAALEQGGMNGQGDSRCTGDGIPSDAAFIQVDLPGSPAGSYLRLSVSNTAPANPLPRLRAMFDTWRKTHPCMMSAAAGAGGDARRGELGIERRCIGFELCCWHVGYHGRFRRPARDRGGGFSGTAGWRAGGDCRCGRGASGRSIGRSRSPAGWGFGGRRLGHACERAVDRRERWTRSRQRQCRAVGHHRRHQFGRGL
ncbi:MAG TPA: DUF1028 domain-containing protein [Polyangiales bacterium]|nr:DUF1028 domain-containing protein [Polyangiales bacterium]